jgi:hypothetical protein
MHTLFATVEVEGLLRNPPEGSGSLNDILFEDVVEVGGNWSNDDDKLKGLGISKENDISSNFLPLGGEALLLDTDDCVVVTVGLANPSLSTGLPALLLSLTGVDGFFP